MIGEVYLSPCSFVLTDICISVHQQNKVFFVLKDTTFVFVLRELAPGSRSRILMRPPRHINTFLTKDVYIKGYIFSLIYKFQTFIRNLRQFLHH